MAIKNYVLVHGACQGGWVWEAVIPYLMTSATVHAPSLTGSGDRFHLLTPNTSLNTHIDDIKHYIQSWNLSNVILVGHSYAGLAISGVIEAIPQYIEHAIYLDAYLPENNRTGFEIIGEPYISDWQSSAQSSGNGWLMKVNDASLDSWGVVDHEHRTFLMNRINDFSINFLKTKLFIGGNYLTVPKTYIRCIQPSYCFDLMLPHYEKAKREGFSIQMINSAHEPMVSDPKELAQCLLKIVNKNRGCSTGT